MVTFAALKATADKTFASFAEVAKPKTVTFAAAPAAAAPLPLPPPPPALVAPPATQMDTAEAAAAATADAKVAELRAHRTHAISLRAAVASMPELLQPLEARIAALDAELSVLLVQRQQALDPHQLCQLLSQRQAQSTTAAKALADDTTAAAAALEASDKLAVEA